MKTIATLTVLALFNIGLNAQNNEPVFEQAGKYIKGTYFHNNGVVAQTGLFLEGRLHGEWVMYNKEGTKIAMGRYEEGKKTGKWFFWQGEGKALREVTYFEGKPVSVVTWNNSRITL